LELYAFERRRWLVDQARQAGRIDVAEVARALTVAKETVRRDLTALESEGLLRRVHGGAIPVERLGFEGTLTLRNSSRQNEKSRIADYAVGLLGAAESIYIDEGSTTQALAERLHPRRPLTVVTNAVPVALLMAPREYVTVILVGGRVRSKTLGTIDHWAVQMLTDFVFDLSMMGTNGLTVERGLSCPDAGVAAVKARVIESSRRSVLLTDSSKIGSDSSYRFAQVRDVATIVTDRSISDGQLRRLRGTGVEAVIV
jgi:DeoR family transcriptional regulator, fructose operon transcriptional repressor